MAAGTLYTYPSSFRANKALIAAQYSGAEVKVDSNFKLGQTNKSADFLKKFPNGKVPAFEGKDGFCLTESNAIAYYVSNNQLHGENKNDSALVQQWISFSDNEILPAACTWTFPCLGITQFNKQETERAKQQVQQALGVLNNHLLTRTFVVGERVTLADICLVCNLQSMYELVMDPSFRGSFGNVNRWFTTMINQPQVKAVLGNVTLASKMANFDAKKYQELHGGAGDKKKEQQKKQKEAAPKKTAEPAPKAEEEPPKPKPNKDPFESLPKGTMDLDGFKRSYSNEDIEKGAIPYFWNNIDKEVYSIWTCEYAESLAGKMNFMVSNLVSGMFQRIEKLRKHAFGSVIIFGESKSNSIKGLWFWRTQDLIFTLSEDWTVDYESYNWKKLDINAEETKKMVRDYFLGEDGGDFGGQVICDHKIFK